MGNLKNTTNVSGQSNKTYSKSQKHDANLRKNSSLYFQVGLILCLLATYGLFEMNFERSIHSVSDMGLVEDDTFIMQNFTIEKVVLEKPKPVEKVVKLSAIDPIIKKDDYVDKEPLKIIIDEPQAVTEPINITVKEPVINKSEDNAPLGVNFVQKVPVYPGCESAATNRARLTCMSDKISKLIQKKFDSELAIKLGLTGVQRIDVQFTIDKTGRVSNIITRAPYEQLEDEAKRVVNKIPAMSPGQQNDVAVDVIYNVPIVFKVQ